MFYIVRTPGLAGCILIGSMLVMAGLAIVLNSRIPQGPFVEAFVLLWLGLRVLRTALVLARIHIRALLGG